MTAHLSGLNPEQERAVRSVDGPLLVLAGAGTGKTRVVTCRIAEIVARGAPPRSVCAVTFTNKAAREMRERADALLGRGSLGGMVVSTFHSLGLRILREFGEAVGVPRTATIADPEDQSAMLQDALRETGLGRDRLHPRMARFRMSLWKNGGVLPDEALEAADEPVNAALAAAYRRYEDELRRRKLLDFDDLILRTQELLDGHADVRATLQDRWRYLLVDEYQDTNVCQYRLVRRLAESHRNLCVVGDDDQSIYGWRGAAPDRILGFTADFPDAVVVTLERNYRSTGPILGAANRLIACNLVRRDKVLRPLSAAGEPVELFVAGDEKDETDYVATRILKLRVQHGLAWERCAVLFRANSQCRPLEMALRERRIPYRVVGTRSFFDRREVRDLLAFLRLARNPDDDAAFLRVVNVPPRGIGRGSVDKLIAWAAEARTGLLAALEARRPELAARAREGGGALLALLGDLSRGFPTRGAGGTVEHLVEATGYRHHLRQTADDPLDLKNRLRAVDELIQAAGQQAAGGTASLEGLLDALSLDTWDKGRDEDDPRGGVHLMTMHAAKGLEFPVVFIVGVEEGLLPHGRSVGAEEDDVEDEASLEEERRLFYVGLTRARERLFLTRCRKRRRFGRETDREPSRFLSEIGTDDLRVLTADEPEAAEDGSGRAWLQAIRARLSEEGGAT